MPCLITGMIKIRRTPDHLAETNGFGGRTFKNKIEEGIYQAKQKLKNKF